MRCAPDAVVTQTALSDAPSARLARAQVSAGQEDGVHRTVAAHAARLTLAQTPVGVLQPLQVGDLIVVAHVSGGAAWRRVFPGHRGPGRR